MTADWGTEPWVPLGHTNTRPDVIVIRLPYEAPPIRSNDRLDRWARARVVKSVREVAAIAGRNYLRTSPEPSMFPISVPVTVTVVWEVVNNRVRDAGSVAPTGKAAIDGLVDAGILLSDRHSIVTEERFRIEVGGSRGLRLEIAPVADPTMPVPGAQRPRQAIGTPIVAESDQPPAAATVAATLSNPEENP